MKRSNSSWVRLFVIAAMAVMLALAAFGGGMVVGAGLGSANGETASLPTLPGFLRSITPVDAAVQASPTPGAEQDLALDQGLFDEAMNLLEDQFYGDLPADEDVTYNAIRGVVDHLGDRNTTFVDPETAALFDADMEGHFEGIGARVDLHEGGGVVLEYLFPEQPARIRPPGGGHHHQGERRGCDASGSDRSRRQDPRPGRVRRDPDHRARRRRALRRHGDAGAIEIPVVETKTLADGKIEYIALTEFSSVAPPRLATALSKAVAKNPTGLILDLRGNPGGLLDAAVRVGSYFVPEGNIVIERTKDGGEREYERRGRYLLARRRCGPGGRRQRQRLGDRGRRHPGCGDRRVDRREDLRQGVGATAQQPERRVAAPGDHRPLVHAQGSGDPRAGARAGCRGGDDA